jgi:[ribosomal protein S5]-alanine N-acetyltransferase
MDRLELHTPRLRLLALTSEELGLYRDDRPALEQQLGLRLNREPLSEPLQRALGMKRIKMAAASPADHPWYTYWLMVLADAPAGIGLIGFKGAPNADGASEVGYGTDAEYQGRGYMTEALQALTAWALQDERCRVVTATTVKNPASERVLRKAGFELLGEGDEGSNWRYTLSRQPEIRERVRFEGAILQGSSVLMIQHREHAGREYWVIPGGGSEPNESEAQTVEREMQEETGLRVRAERLLIDHWINAFGIRERHKIYLCSVLAGEPKAGYEPEAEAQAFYAITAVRWFDLSDEHGWPEDVFLDPITLPILRKIQTALGFSNGGEHEHR